MLTLPDLPFPANTGKRLRGSMTLNALAEVSDLDVIVFADQTEPAPSGLPLHSYQCVPLRARGRMRSLAGLARGLPVRLGAWQPAGGPWTGHWDIAWFGALDHRLWLPKGFGADRTVVDLDDLESNKAALQIDIAGGIERWQRTVERPLWRRLEKATAGWADVTVVCSALDEQRLADIRGRDAGIAIVPNTYAAPSEGAELGGRLGAPLTLIGNFDYEPNLDAARFLAYEILPIARSLDPDIRFRLVGRDRTAGLSSLSSISGLEVVGEVPDVADYLQDCSVAIVPLRVGGGTRIKILEAMAWGIPVITTTIGREGLEVDDVVITADDARSFATSCVRLYRDPTRREDLSIRARARYLDRYTPQVSMRSVQAIIASLMHLQ